jgi:hypothetical protein
MSERSAVERTHGGVATPRAAHRPVHAPDAALGDDWASLLLRWDIAPGTPSERALATAVLLDAPRYPSAVRRVAAIILTTFDAATADG